MLLLVFAPLPVHRRACSPVIWDQHMRTILIVFLFPPITIENHLIVNVCLMWNAQPYCVRFYKGQMFYWSKPPQPLPLKTRCKRYDIQWKNCDTKHVFQGPLQINTFLFFQKTNSLCYQTLKFSLEHCGSYSSVVSLHMKEWSESQTGVRTRKYPGWVLQSQSGKSWASPCHKALALLWMLLGCRAVWLMFSLCAFTCLLTHFSPLKLNARKSFWIRRFKTAVFLHSSCVCMRVCLHVCLPRVAGGPPSQWTTKDADRHTNTQTCTGLSLRISIDIYSKPYACLWDISISCLD